MTREEATKILRQMAGTDNYRARYSAFTDRSRVSASGVPRKIPMLPGQLNLRAGKEPTKEDIDRFMQLHSRSAEKAQGLPPSAAGASAPAPAPGGSSVSSYRAKIAANAPPALSLREQLAADFQRQQAAANEANEARYAEGHGELSDLRTRNQDRVGNWGKVQEQLNREKADSTMKQVEANLAGRGLGNSTLTDAFRLRNERDLAMLNQDISERRDDRLSRYDTADTGALTGFIERRTDRGPDQAMLNQLAAKLGEAEAYQAANTQAPPAPTPAYQPPEQRRGFGGGGMSARQAMRMQYGMQGMNPVNAANQMFGYNFNQYPDPRQVLYGGMGRNQTNAFPHRYGESRQDAYYRRMNG